jgi:hypothetical protein
MQLQLVAPWGYSQRPKNIHELRAAAAAMINGVDMITGFVRVAACKLRPLVFIPDGYISDP